MWDLEIMEPIGCYDYTFRDKFSNYDESKMFDTSWRARSDEIFALNREHPLYTWKPLPADQTSARRTNRFWYLF